MSPIILISHAVMAATLIAVGLAPLPKVVRWLCLLTGAAGFVCGLVELWP